MHQTTSGGRVGLSLIVITLLALAADAALRPVLPGHVMAMQPAAAAGLQQRLDADTERLIVASQARLRTVPDDAQAYVRLVMPRLYRANGVNLDLELALFAADHGDDPDTIVSQARAAYAQRPSIQAADVLAWTLYRAGGFEEARRYAEQALRLGTQDPSLFFHAGMIFRHSGDADQARHYLERALALNPQFSIRFAAEACRTLEELQAVALASDR